ncbi:hypothetical protein Pmar_PMAR011076 [Perkinsus marinus ATCC 50983]|uniref:Cathepsin propeptide inhibitor domain-containing protein n=1 Tax=Perkinsus marinus (strain ATCC 50983 / TXsc) TaxID=423536 RepID=C5KVM8_PERM5|nr:hypothetical protein Pmar_PMAR011076 [Perkinsus marinus ATCC 50983]EER11413.1 hypothetical protein Pmar_PMAR011076 [Perkinsus marinus ATCC 50983]|eukprot:XP_002779618.1 hypothetical protein Pmar_PMAR011076 [Perkinsus marinus ATCC 50983]
MWFTVGILSLVIVAQGVVRGSSQVTGVSDIEQAFREFIRTYNKKYGSKEQYEVAKAAFMHSLREINDLKAYGG